MVDKHDSELSHRLKSEQFFGDHFIEEETFNHLYLEINNLPVGLQKIMLLVITGCKNQEIADELNISINTVKSQKQIALSKLKDRQRPSRLAAKLPASEATTG